MNVTKSMLVILLLLGLAGCGANVAGSDTRFVLDAETFDRRAMLENIVETSILPLHEQVVAEAAALEQAAHTFRDDPNVENLAALQAQWRTTAEAWAAAEHLGFRFTMIIHNQIKKWPINTNFIEEFITAETEPIDEPFIEAIGSTSKGVTAIEYLIFDPEAGEEAVMQALTEAPRRMAYMVALTENLSRKAQELQAMWSPEGENQAQAFIEADFSANEVQGSISMLANELIEQAELTANDRIDYPLSGVYAEPQPQAVESPYANHSIPLAIANLRGMQQTFNAGYNDYLDFLGATYNEQPLSTAIDGQIEAAIAALEAIESSLSTAVLENPAAVEQAYEESKMLIVLLKADMANQLGITVTFSDNDGD